MFGIAGPSGAGPGHRCPAVNAEQKWNPSLTDLHSRTEAPGPFCHLQPLRVPRERARHALAPRRTDQTGVTRRAQPRCSGHGRVRCCTEQGPSHLAQTAARSPLDEFAGGACGVWAGQRSQSPKPSGCCTPVPVALCAWHWRKAQHQQRVPCWYGGDGPLQTGTRPFCCLFTAPSFCPKSICLEPCIYSHQYLLHSPHTYCLWPVPLSLVLGVLQGWQPLLHRRLQKPWGSC